MLARVLAHLRNMPPILAGLKQHLPAGLGGFLRQKAGEIVGDPLGRAASLHQQGGAVAGRRLLDHDAGGVVGGGEQEHIRQGVIRPQRLPVVNRPRKGDRPFQPDPLGVGLYIRRVEPVPHQEGPEGHPLPVQIFQRVQNETHVLVPHHTPHEQENELILPHAVLFPQRVDFPLRRPAVGKIGAIFHHVVAAPVPHVPQGAAAALCHHPDLVHRVDVVEQELHGDFPHTVQRHPLGDVHVEFGVEMCIRDRADIVRRGAHQGLGRHPTDLHRVVRD